MPARAIRCAASPPSSRPSNRIRPPLAGKCPLTTLMKVDLPEPLGPSRPRISPGKIFRLTPIERLHALEGLGEAAHFQEGRSSRDGAAGRGCCLRRRVPATARSLHGSASCNGVRRIVGDAGAGGATAARPRDRACAPAPVPLARHLRRAGSLRPRRRRAPAEHEAEDALRHEQDHDHQDDADRRLAGHRIDAGVKKYSRQVIASAPTAGPAQ